MKHIILVNDKALTNVVGGDLAAAEEIVESKGLANATDALERVMADHGIVDDSDKGGRPPPTKGQGGGGPRV